MSTSTQDLQMPTRAHLSDSPRQIVTEQPKSMNMMNMKAEPQTQQAEPKLRMRGGGVIGDCIDAIVCFECCKGCCECCC